MSARCFTFLKIALTVAEVVGLFGVLPENNHWLYLYRLLASDLQGYEHNTASTLYEKFIYNNGSVEIKDGNICLTMKKKRNLPELLTAIQKFQHTKLNWLKNFSLEIKAASNT